VKLSNVAPRAVTGAFILHAGLDKWGADDATAAGTHGLAAGTYPMLNRLPATRFLKLLSIGEMVTGAALLVPVIPDRIAGAALAGFSGALVGVYARTPGMRRPNSVWPTQQGIGLSKDVWMLGIAIGLLMEG